MSADLPDADARSAIASDLGRTLFVEAGAGSGKTTALVDRVVELVLTSDQRQRTPLSAIAAITFTEAAAAELRARIRARFEQELLEAQRSGGHQRASLCSRALEDADIAAISTLHSFAHRMLAEFPMDVGIPPRVEVLDEVQSQLAFDHRWSAFIDSLFADDSLTEFIVRASMLDLRLTGPQSQLRVLARIFDDNWDRLAGVDSGSPRPLEIRWNRLAAPMGAVRDAVSWCVDPSDRLLEHLEANTMRIFDTFDAAESDVARLRSLNDLAQLKKGGNLGRKDAWDGRAGDVRDLIDTVKLTAETLRQEVITQTLGLFAARIAEFTVAAADERRADGRLEFHDLLVLARTLLRTSTTARAALSERYQVVMLDEFQDTDPIQIELALLLTSPAGDGSEGADTAGDIERLIPEPGRLFMVGDPKQSIYRFRRADLELFLSTAERFAAGHTVLTQNFRTVRPVIEVVNALFEGRLMRDHEQPLDFHTLTPDRSGSGSGCDHRPLILTHEADASAPELRTIEAELVADTIAGIGRNPEAWLVEGDVAQGEPEWRRPRLSDITILVPARTSVPQLTAALDAQSISYRADTGSLVYETQPVREVLSVLRAIDDPADQVALVAALRSPLYGCGDDDLWRYRQAGGEWDLRRSIPAEAEDSSVAAAIGHLRTLADRRWWDEPSALLSRVIDERAAMAVAAHSRHARDTWRRLRYVLDQARAFAEANGGDLRAYLRWADLQGLDGSRAHEPMLEEPDLDAVRIMTIHGAKGLEFPITVVSGLTTRPASRRGGLKVSWNENGSVPEVSVTKALQTEGFNRSSELDEIMDDNEKLRLLYVGLTRARDHLIVSGVSKVDARGKPAPSHGRLMYEFATGAGAGLVRTPETQGVLFETAVEAPTVFVPPGGEVPTDDPYGDMWWRHRTQALQRAGTPRVRSATALAAVAAAELPVVDPDEDAPPNDDEQPVKAFRRGRAGTAIGSAVHGVLQYLDLADPDDASISRLSEAQAWAESVPDHVETIEQAVHSALGAPTVQRCRTDRHWKEVFVAAPVGGITVEGYIDLLVDGPTGLTIVDYKTDSVRTDADVDEKLAVYRLQGAAYAAAIEASTGLVVEGIEFVFTRPGGALSRRVDDVRGVIAEVTELATSVSNADAGSAPV